MIEEITINTHSSIRIQGDRIIYFDPYQIKDETHDADVIFVTHDHYDHFDPASIEKILKDDTMMVIPRSCFDAWSDSGLIVTQVVQMDPGEKLDMGGIVIETVPAYNMRKLYHPRRKKWLGYLVTMEDRRIYVAGDTDLTEENRQVRCDIAFVPVGGKYTMNAEKAAELIRQIQPEIAVPTHYGSVVGSESDGLEFKRAVGEGIRVPLLIHFAAAQEELPQEAEAEAASETEIDAESKAPPAEEREPETPAEEEAQPEAQTPEEVQPQAPAAEAAEASEE